MTLKVIGCGFGRTGVSSLKTALERLGFGECYHATEALGKARAVTQWCAVLDGKPDWRSIFEGYESAVGWPASAYYRELMEAFPEAKLILTIREPESWYESVRETLYPLAHLMPPVWFTWLSKAARDARRVMFEVVWHGLFRGRFENKDYAIGVYKAYNESVRKHVPPDRLLVFDVRQGWAPLCEFLGVEAPPDEPFPHANEGTLLKTMVRRMRISQITIYAMCAVALIWLTYLVAT